MCIRKATKSDYDQVWNIFRLVIRSGDTYVFSENTPKADLEKHWFAEYMDTYVWEENGEILGTYILKPNQIDLGSHIANASYMVHPRAYGKGIGKALCLHSIKEAKYKKYIAMQFNLVVSTNTRAVDLWQYLGFKIIATIPKAFNHKIQGFVDAFVMFKSL